MDDSTFAQRMSSLKHPGEMLSVIAEIVSDAKKINNLVNNIRSAA